MEQEQFFSGRDSLKCTSLDRQGHGQRFNEQTKSDKAGEAGIDIISDLVNQVIAERVIPTEWELSTIENCYKGMREAFERGKYTGLKLTEQVLKAVERDTKKLMKQQLDINVMQFGFIPGCETTNVIFIFETVTGEIFSEKEEFVFVDLGKACN